MKLPKITNRHCPYCKSHESHKITQVKKKQASSMTQFSKYRAAKRGRWTGTGNAGKLARGALSGWKRYNKKGSKKTDLRYECQKCKKQHQQKTGFRAKKVEFV